MPFNGMVSRQKLSAVATSLCLALVGVSSAGAQSVDWSDRVFLNLNTTVQLTATPFDDGLAPVIYAERAVLTTTHPGDDGQWTIEPAGGVRIWRNLGIGAALTRRTATETTTVRALVPHPVLFNQPRVAAMDAPFERSDFSVHVHALVMLPIHPRLDVALSAGPSFISVRQDVLRGVEVTETGAPFTTATIAAVTVLTREASTVGLNAGVDVTWFLTRMAGMGVTTRYVQGYAATTLTDGRPVDLNVGGLQFGVGARLRFQ